jgi:hypothetical protein
MEMAKAKLFNDRQIKLPESLAVLIQQASAERTIQLFWHEK